MKKLETAKGNPAFLTSGKFWASMIALGVSTFLILKGLLDGVLWVNFNLGAIGAYIVGNAIEHRAKAKAIVSMNTNNNDSLEGNNYGRDAQTKQH